MEFDIGPLHMDLIPNRTSGARLQLQVLTGFLVGGTSVNPTELGDRSSCTHDITAVLHPRQCHFMAAAAS